MTCISSASFSLLITGSPFGMFKSSRGLRKGDPLSPTLFTIFIDLLSIMLCRTKVDVCIHGVKICRRAPTITHLLYADDATLSCRADLNEASNLQNWFMWCVEDTKV